MVWGPADDRGQTPQDFAIGASIVLVTIIGTFAFVQGGVFTAYEEPVSGDVESSADRVASYLVEEYSVDGERNVLRYNDSGDGIKTNLDTYSAADQPRRLETLELRSGIDATDDDRRRTPSVNVTIVNSSALRDSTRVPAAHAAARPDGPVPGKLAWGQPYQGQDGTASATRVVTLSDPGKKCHSVCWLVVRVW